LPLQRWKIGFIFQLLLQQETTELTSTNDDLALSKKIQKKEIRRIQVFIKQVVQPG
jgi:hypothetical protein